MWRLTSSNHLLRLWKTGDWQPAQRKRHRALTAGGARRHERQAALANEGDEVLNGRTIERRWRESRCRNTSKLPTLFIKNPIRGEVAFVVEIFDRRQWMIWLEFQLAHSEGVKGVHRSATSSAGVMQWHDGTVWGG